MLVTLYDQSIPHSLEAFIDNFNKRNCVHYASAILKDDEYLEEINVNLSVQRAQEIFRTLNIPVVENFIPVYRAINDEAYVDWKLSRMAAFLTVLNGDPTSPLVAKLQMACFK